MSGVASVSGDAPAEERSVNDSHAPSEGNATMSEIIAAATSDEGSQESTAKEKDTSDPEKKDTDAEASEPAVSEAETNATTTSARPWDHSNRKVLLQGVMKFQNSKAVTKSLDKWIERFNSSSSSGDLQLKYDKVKKPPKETWMVVTLQSEDMVEPFIRFINETEDITNKRGNKIFAKRANEDDRNDNRKRQRPSEDADREQSPTKRQRVSDDEGLQTRRFVTEEEVKDKIIPLWKLSEKEQVEIKMKEMIKKCAMSVVKELKARFRKLSKERNRPKTSFYPWIEQKRAIDMKPLITAPTPLRNKSEFTFGYRYLFPSGEQTDPAEDHQNGMDDGTGDPRRVPAVGFMVLGWSGGVSRPHCCGNIPPEVCSLVDVVDEFLSSSPLPPYDSKSHKGFWRVMTVRSSRRTLECMVTIQHSPPAVGGRGEKDDPYDYTKDFDTEKSRLVSLLTEAEFHVPEDGHPPLKVTSIFFQEYGGLSSPPPGHPVQHVYGKTCLTEELGKCRFQISPGAFFQVNTEGAEMLYQLVVDKVREVSDDPAKTLLFDVCCGTGTIGMTCMKEGAVGQVVGVDISEPAVEDAKKNAELNGFGTGDDLDSGKTRFVAAKAEMVLAQEIAKTKRLGLNFVAVVDPAREGLHPDVIKTLRLNERIKRIVYVSCNPTGTLVRDAALLCAPPTKRYAGRPFRVTSASPVDMFPLTSHCEMVMTFDRLADDEIPGDVNSK